MTGGSAFSFATRRISYSRTAGHACKICGLQYCTSAARVGGNAKKDREGSIDHRWSDRRRNSETVKRFFFFFFFGCCCCFCCYCAIYWGMHSIEERAKERQHRKKKKGKENFLCFLYYMLYSDFFLLFLFEYVKMNQSNATSGMVRNGSSSRWRMASRLHLESFHVKKCFSIALILHLCWACRVLGGLCQDFLLLTCVVLFQLLCVIGQSEIGRRLRSPQLHQRSIIGLGSIRLIIEKSQVNVSWTCIRKKKERQTK